MGEIIMVAICLRFGVSFLLPLLSDGDADGLVSLVSGRGKLEEVGNVLRCS